MCYAQNALIGFSQNLLHSSYVKGELKAVGYISSKAICEDVKITTGEPFAIKLKRENFNAKQKGDIAVFTCYVVDKDVNAVPDASEYVNFFTSKNCNVVGTGSDVCDHNPVWLPARKMREGTISVADMLNSVEENEFKLFAKSDRLGIAVLTFNI